LEKLEFLLKNIIEMINSKITCRVLLLGEGKIDIIFKKLSILHETKKEKVKILFF